MQIETIVDARTGIARVYVNGTPVNNDPGDILAAYRDAMVCSPRQARLAMMATPYPEAASLLAAVEAAIYASGNQGLIVSWEYGVEWRRNDENIAALAVALGLSDQDVDNLFALAATL
jgi:hypothetical protein